MAEFFNNFTLVSQNVFVLFLLMAVGFAANKFKIINDNGAKCLSDLALRIVNPAVIISGFIREYDPELMGRYLITLAISILASALRNCCETNICLCTSLTTLSAGVAGTVIASLILLLADIATAGIIGSLITGLFFASFALTITSAICIAKNFASCNK